MGDHIKPQKTRLHSRFRRVVNFVGEEDRLISVVSPEIGPGPLYIECKDTVFHRIRTLEIYSNHIRINGGRIDILQGQIYCSQLESGCFSSENYRKNLCILKEFVVREAHPMSLAFLLDPKRQEVYPGKCKTVFFQRCKAAVALIEAGDIQAGLSRLAGLGPGLTPAGDDFIAGFLLGINIIERMAGMNRSRLKNEIFKCAVSENPISKTFLYLAKKGMFSGIVKSLVYALFSKEGYDLSFHARRLLSLGSTSGADICVGLITALEGERNL